MAYKEVAALEAETTISLGGVNKKTGKPNPKQVEGYFLGVREVPNSRSKSGNSNLYILQTPSGNLGVWGKTDLDKKMKGATAGAMTRITQSGTAKTPNGEMYKFKVEVDQDNVINTSFASSLSSEDSADDDVEAVGGYVSSEELDNEDELQNQALAAAQDRKAKLQAILNGSKSKKVN